LNLHLKSNVIASLSFSSIVVQDYVKLKLNIHKNAYSCFETEHPFSQAGQASIRHGLKGAKTTKAIIKICC